MRYPGPAGRCKCRTPIVGLDRVRHNNAQLCAQRIQPTWYREPLTAITALGCDTSASSHTCLRDNGSGWVLARDDQSPEDSRTMPLCYAEYPTTADPNWASNEEPWGRVARFDDRGVSLWAAPEDVRTLRAFDACADRTGVLVVAADVARRWRRARACARWHAFNRCPHAGVVAATHVAARAVARMHAFCFSRAAACARRCAAELDIAALQTAHLADAAARARAQHADRRAAAATHATQPDAAHTPDAGRDDRTFTAAALWRAAGRTCRSAR